MLMIGSQAVVAGIKQSIAHKFNITVVLLGHVNQYLDMAIERDRSNRCIYINQRGYLERMLEQLMTGCNWISTPVDPNVKLTPRNEMTEEKFDQQEYQRAIGCLGWAKSGTRPDIGYAVSMLGRYAADLGLKH
jgi:hypothetical protein